MTLLLVLKYKNFIDPGWVGVADAEYQKKVLKIKDVEVEPSEELSQVVKNQKIIKNSLKILKENVKNKENLELAQERLEMMNKELARKADEMEEEEVMAVLYLLN